MSKSSVLTLITASILAVSGCTAGQSTPADHSPGATETPTKVRHWGETVDNEQGVTFSVAEPRWVPNALGTPVLRVTTTATNQGRLELSGVGVRAYRTERGPATVRLASRGENEVTLVPGESTRDARTLSVPAGAHTLQVVVAQGTAPTATSPAVDIRFTGPIPPKPSDPGPRSARG